MIWNIQLQDLLSGKVRIETIEGAVRTGTVTNIVYHEVELLGRKVKAPKAIEMDHDSNDYLDWALIKKINRLNSPT